MRTCTPAAPGYPFAPPVGEVAPARRDNRPYISAVNVISQHYSRPARAAGGLAEKRQNARSMLSVRVRGPNGQRDGYLASQMKKDAGCPMGSSASIFEGILYPSPSSWIFSLFYQAIPAGWPDRLILSCVKVDSNNPGKSRHASHLGGVLFESCE